MIAGVLTLFWPEVAGVRELTRMLAKDGFFCGVITQRLINKLYHKYF